MTRLLFSSNHLAAEQLFYEFPQSVLSRFLTARFEEILYVGFVFGAFVNKISTFAAYGFHSFVAEKPLRRGRCVPCRLDLAAVGSTTLSFAAL
jgi:hypothetical protein